MRSVIADLRRVCPDRPLNIGESLRVAEVQAAKLLAASAITEAPVPEGVVTGLPRIEVVRLARIPVSGSVHWAKGRWLVAINKSEPLVRQRFSLAHELKHVLDAPFGTRLYPDWRGLTGHERAEQVANYFAGCLWMPRSWVKRAFYDEGLMDPVALAGRFGVSREAMRVRLSILGLVSPQARCGVREAA